MPGSTSRRDPQEDPRDNTVDLPRIDVDGLTDYFRRAAPMLEPEPAELLEPLPDQEPSRRLEPRPGDLRHPYPEPDEPRPSPWRAVDGTPAPAAEVAPALPVPDPPVADPDGATPAAAAPASAESAPAAEAEPAKPRPDSSRPAAEAAARPRVRAAGSGGRAPAGSLADLRLRLARLPDGHPSSPYEDDGHERPVPIRLKHLELGLPAPGREAATGHGADADAADNRVSVDAVEAEHRATEAPTPPATEPRAAVEPAAEVDSEPPGPRTDLTLGPWRDTPSRRVSGLGALSPRGGNGHGAAHGYSNGSGRRQSPVEPDHVVDRKPSEADRADTAQHRITDPPAVDLRELVERTLAASRTAEGRNVFGSYGSSGLTPMLQRIAAHLPFGSLAPDSEANSLKSADRLAAKLARLVTRNPGRTAEELVASIGDVVRYAFTFEVADYVEGTWLVHRRLKSHGFELELRRNRWESAEYKGIFTQWRDPAHNIAFEVQFHTTASWAVAQRTHEAYVQIIDPATPPAERARLRARQVAAAAAATAPPNWAELGDFRLEAR
jgi:hypothetical protein